MSSVTTHEREQFDEEHRCEEFTPADGFDRSGERTVFGAAICPHCEHANALIGDPADFHGQVIRCMGCTWVMVLDSAALAAFETEVVTDAA